MWRFRNILLLCLLCCMSFPLFAQKTTVRATIQPSDILIGEQAVVNVEAIAPKEGILYSLFLEIL